MYNIDYSTKEDVKQQNQNRPKISETEKSSKRNYKKCIQ